MSDSQPGEPVAAAFPHLASAYPQLCFSSQAEVREDPVRSAADGAVLRRSPRGVRRAHRCAAQRRRAGRNEAAGGRYLGGLPLRHRRRPTARCTSTRTARRRASRSSPAQCRNTWPNSRHRTSPIPGCFASAILLASVPVLAAGLINPSIFVSGVTGSTGSGRKPVPGTHHPLRHGDLYSYSALQAPPRAGGRPPAPRPPPGSQPRSPSCRTRARLRAAST